MDKNLFIVSVPAHDGRAIPKSIATLMDVARILNRKVVLNVQYGTGLANVRNWCVKAVQQIHSNAEYAYMFWLDSDIIIEEDPQTIAKYVQEAEEKDVSFSGAYCVSNQSITHDSDNIQIRGFSVFNPETGKSYLLEELHAARPFELRLLHAGLGLCYIKMPLKYEFRTQGNYLDDFLFFKDNPQIDIRYVPISNTHVKSIGLSFK